MDVSKINRLNNEYSALISDAINIRYGNNDMPSRLEGLRYQQAAQICSELARLTIGSEERHWVICKENCEKHMHEIAVALGLAKKSPAKPTPPPAPAKSQETPAPDQSPEQDDAFGDDIPPETVAQWFNYNPDHGLASVVGMEDTIALLQSCVNDAGHSELDEFLDMPTVRSFFFYGPPGCGKTFTIDGFVHDLKNQKGYKAMKLGSADIHSKFSGEADKIVKRAFAEAGRNAPCLLFIDEIDGVCQNRSMPHLSDFNMQLTTTFLTAFNELNALNKQRKSVIFIGATNYPANVDTAMLDRVELVQIPLPDEKLRAHSFARKFQNIQLEDGYSWTDAAAKTEGYNQRDINRVVSRIRTLMRKDILECYSNDKDAIAALKSGAFRLRFALVEQALSENLPTPKNDIEQQLNDFESKIRRL